MKRGIPPLDIMAKKAFENAITIDDVALFHAPVERKAGQHGEPVAR